MNMKLGKTLILILLSYQVIGYSYDFSFIRKLECNQLKPPCKTWNDTVSLVMAANVFAAFNLHTLVLTPQGPQQIENLKIGDSIYGYEQSTGKNKFTPLLGWLHRSPDALFEYSSIKTHKNLTYNVGSIENVAHYLNDQINFKTSNNFKKGESIHSFGDQVRFDSIKHNTEARGIFSPYTQTGNFYIYPNEKLQTQDPPMILVHCLGNVLNPIEESRFVSLGMKLFSYVYLNKEPQANQFYNHPLTHLLLPKSESKQINVTHDYTSYNNNNAYYQRQRSLDKLMSVLSLMEIDRVKYLK